MNRRDFMHLGMMSPVIAGIDLKSLDIQKPSSVKHSVCEWCFSKFPLEHICEKAQDLGIHSIELLHPHQWDTVHSYGLECAVGYANDWGLTKGFNNPKNHDQLISDYSIVIPYAADKNISQIICFPGNRNGLNDEEGLENCARGLEPVVKLAEKNGVIITMELMNSKLDHPDYQCDSTEWAVRLVDKIGSPNFKLLYDIYHMQIMEGDIIATISKYKDYISHFHTAGVPGRNEIDATQELNYSAIIQSIRENGFQGFVGQEFIPTWEDPFKALSVAIDICNT